MQSVPAASARRSTLADIAALIALVTLCLAVGYIGSIATTPNLDPWYASLEKPSWTPPSVAFPIVWTILYIAMAVAAWLAWRSDADPAWRHTAMIVFAVQLALNAAWSWAFFAAQSPALGLLVIAALIVAILWTVRAFFAVSRAAGILLLPYLAWVVFASGLNAAIFMLNG